MTLEITAGASEIGAIIQRKIFESMTTLIISENKIK